MVQIRSLEMAATELGYPNLNPLPALRDTDGRHPRPRGQLRR